MADTEATREGAREEPARSTGVIATISDFCGRNRFLVYLSAVALTLFGLWSARQTPLDALPDLSDTQVIVATEWMGRNPTLIEDQITYPIATTFLGAPRVKSVRGFTMFGMSFVYVIFHDGTDLYWARSRVIEYLSKVAARLPEGSPRKSDRTQRASGGSTSTRCGTRRGGTTSSHSAACRTGH